MSVSSASARTFRSLQRHRNYRLWFGGQVVSITGTWVQNVAQAWFIVELTGAPVALGLLALFQFGPFALLGLLGGSIVDRFDKRKTILGTQAAQMVSAVVLATLALTHSAQVWEVFLLAAVNGLVQVLDMPARQAFVIEMVGRDELPNAIALNVSVFNAARVVGPAMGGLIIAGVGVGLCFAINAISFLAVIAGLLLMHPDDFYSVERDRQANVLRSMAEGLAYVARNRAAMTICWLMLVVATFGINFSVLLPVLASRTLQAGPQTFGLLSACFGGGALVGALIAASRVRPSWGLLLGGGALYSGLLLVLAPLHWVWAISLVLVLTGIAFTTYTSTSNAALQMIAPDRLRGRVMGIYGYVFIGSLPLGGLLAGWLSQVGGTELGFGVGGLVSLLAVAVAAMRHGSVSMPRRLRRHLHLDSDETAIVQG